MCDQPRIVCATCGTDLGPAAIRAFRDQHGRTDWQWDRTPAEPHDCPADQEDPAP